MGALDFWKAHQGQIKPTGLLRLQYETDSLMASFSPPNPPIELKDLSQLQCENGVLYVQYTGVPQGRLTRRDETAGTMAYSEESRWKSKVYSMQIYGVRQEEGGDDI